MRLFVAMLIPENTSLISGAASIVFCATPFGPVRGDFVRHFLLSTFIVALYGFCQPSEALAEERLIAVVMANSQPRYQEVHAAFVKQAAGFCDKDCRIYVQTPNADTMSLRNSVRKAVALGADIIVTYGPLATIAAKAELPPVPTIFADVYDPVGMEIVAAGTKTGRNMTGIRGDAPVQGLFKYFTDTVDVRKLGIIFDGHSPEALLQKQVLEETSHRKGIIVFSRQVGDAHNYLAALGDLPDDVDGIFVASSERHQTQLGFITGYTNARKIPVITQLAGAADQGAFMVLETSALEQGEKLAAIAGRVFSGESVQQIPMQTPHGISFVINLKQAKDLGIKVPIQTLSVASRVVH